jgi:hypothetical protein
LDGIGSPPHAIHRASFLLSSPQELITSGVFCREHGTDSVGRPENTNSVGASGGPQFSSPNLSETEKTKALMNVYYGEFRPPRPTSSRVKEEKAGKDKEVSLLRKRTNSGPMPESPKLDGTMKQPAPGPSGTAGAGGTIQLKPGVNALSQLQETLGEADFSGWMMKKGERYNTWKTRFFYLSGPHMYYLRSKTVRPFDFFFGSGGADVS